MLLNIHFVREAWILTVPLEPNPVLAPPRIFPIHTPKPAITIRPAQGSSEIMSPVDSTQEAFQTDENTNLLHLLKVTYEVLNIP